MLNPSGSLRNSLGIGVATHPPPWVGQLKSITGGRNGAVVGVANARADRASVVGASTSDTAAASADVGAADDVVLVPVSAAFDVPSDIVFENQVDTRPTCV